MRPWKQVTVSRKGVTCEGELNRSPFVYLGYKVAVQRLSLSEALASNRLEDFISQAENDGVGPVDTAELMATLEATIKPPQSKDQTSRSASLDGSTGK